MSGHQQRERETELLPQRESRPLEEEEEEEEPAAEEEEGRD